MSAVLAQPGAGVPAPEERSRPVVLTPISWKAPIAYGVIAALALVFFLWQVPSGVESTFLVSTPRDLVQIGAFSVPSRASAVLLTLLALALAGYVAVATRARRAVGAWVPILYGIALIGAFLVWAVAGKASALPLPNLFAGALFLSVPLVFGALAGLLCERSGIINIAIEGQLLAGAFLGAVVATVSGSAIVGLVAAPIAGAAVGALLVFFAVKYQVDQIIVGVVLNVLVIGLTSYLFSTVLTNDPQSLNSPPKLDTIAIPVLSEIPIIGPTMFRQTILVYIMYAAVVVLQIMVFRSRWGLRMRSVGEHPKAADTVGINVNRTRIRNTIFGGAVAGLGGAAFTIASGVAFGKEMTSGKGYIALAAMILGRWSPKGALAAALLFGFADSLRGVLGIVGSPVPSQFLAMLPYLATIFAVAGLVGRVRPPAAEGKPYVK
jgi:ABC-type uncharacterized transport system permease subunit